MKLGTELMGHPVYQIINPINKGRVLTFCFGFNASDLEVLIRYMTTFTI